MKTIYDMNISARAKSCLLRAGYKNVSEIKNITNEEFLSIHNLNERCLVEIKEALKECIVEDEMSTATVNAVQSVPIHSFRSEKVTEHSDIDNAENNYKIEDGFYEKYKADISRVVPDFYRSFSCEDVDDKNYSQLWNELQMIRNRYRALNYYENGLYISDLDSELCYEQGKLLENVNWNGFEITVAPEIDIPYYCTYRKMDYHQLRYYIYWRTCFRKGIIIETDYGDYIKLCVNELLADFGPFTPEERLEQLERLYIKFKSKLGHVAWVGQYASYHRLEIHDDTLRERANKGVVYEYESSYRNVLDIINGNYDNAIRHMKKISLWKYGNSSFVKKTNCSDSIKVVIGKTLPKLEKLFSNAGIRFSDFFAGKLIKTGGVELPYRGSFWKESVIRRIGLGNEIREAYACDDIYEYVYNSEKNAHVLTRKKDALFYPDPYLSEYILKYTEMLFRQKVGYTYIDFPLKLLDVRMQENNNENGYDLSVDSKLPKDERIYISLYTDIENIIIETANDYFDNHAEEINSLKNLFKRDYKHLEENSYEKKTPVDERMAACICEDCVSDRQFERLLSIYNEASPSFKKSKARKMACLIWDFWIIRNNNTAYVDLVENVLNNRWYIIEKKAIVERNYEAALPFLCSFFDVLNGVASKRIDTNLIKDCIIISFSLIDRLLDSYGIDSSNVILGKWETVPWTPFKDMEEIQNVKYEDVRKNVGGLEFYYIESEKKEGTVSRHSYSEESECFISYIIKNIENKIRKLTGYKSFLSIKANLQELYDYVGYKEACGHIDKVITGVVEYVYNHAVALKHESAFTGEISVSNDMKSNYIYKGVNTPITDIDVFIEEGLKHFYGDDYLLIEKAPSVSMNVISVDFDGFEKWCNRNQERVEIHQHFSKIQVHRFYEIYYDVLNRFTSVCECYPVIYNPEYNFLATDVMDDINGLTGKDLSTLTNLIAGNREAFLQWLSSIEQGKILIPKNMQYIQLMFHFAMNRVIFNSDPEKCLLILCEVWNYYYDSPEKIDASSDLLLEWIKDYWMVYCPNIEYHDFKKLFRYEIFFENESSVIYANKHFLVDMSDFGTGDLLAFYNSNCDYHVLDGTVVKKGYRGIFEEAIEEVHKELSKLWEKYEIKFLDYLVYENKEQLKKQRELFYRGILTRKTKRYLRTAFEGRRVSESEYYRVGYDYTRNWPLLMYEQTEISNCSSRMLLDYIIKNTERVIRDHLGFSYNFRFDDRKMYELFPIKLFKDNIQNHIIVRTIAITTDRICRKNGI